MHVSFRAQPRGFDNYEFPNAIISSKHEVLYVLRIIWPLAIVCFTLGCGSEKMAPMDADAATARLIAGVDQGNSSDIRLALGSGARADALASLGNSALHYAAQHGDFALAAEILQALSIQKQSSANIAAALSQTNKQDETALEIATRKGHKQILNAIASFCESQQILRTVFFPAIKKLAALKEQNLGLLTQLSFLKGLAAQLIYETVGTKEGQAITASFSNSDAFLREFAKAYLLGLESSQEVQQQFFKIASGFRISKRAELINLMREEASKDLYRNFEQQIMVLTAQFGIPVRAAEEPQVSKPQENVSVKPEKQVVVDEKKIPADHNALLRDAVSSGNVGSIQKQLEAGARLDAVNADLQNVFHLAARYDRADAMTFMLSQLQCSNAYIVLSAKDTNGKSPFAVAALGHSAQNPRTLKAMSEFLLSGQACHDIAKKEVREWVKEGNETAIKNVFTVFSEAAHGIEVLSDLVFRLVGGEFSEKAISWVETSLCKDAKDHLWSRTYFKALTSNDEERKALFRSIVNRYDDAERQQIVGFMLFLSSAHSDKNVRTSILNEASELKLAREVFDGSSDGVGDIKAALDEIVTGQENAKISLAVAIKNHYERVAKGLKKSNILILGPSGTGKTLLVQTIAKKLDVPFALFDATNITQAGYVGGKASDAVKALAQNADFNKAKTQRGIIFLDEIDKMASRSGRADSDEFKRQGQSTLLKLLEGIEVEVEIGRGRSVSIDTKDILFVCAGAFTGLKDIIETRLKTEGRTLSEHYFEQAMAEDIIKYGMAPEMLGRLPNVITLRALNVTDMVHILNNPKASVLEEYREVFTARGVELKFTEGAIKAIAERAVTYNVGARGLRTVAESVMSDLQFRVGQMGLLKSVTVTERMVRYGDMPTLEYKDPPPPPPAPVPPATPTTKETPVATEAQAPESD